MQGIYILYIYINLSLITPDYVRNVFQAKDAKACTDFCVGWIYSTTPLLETNIATENSASHKECSLSTIQCQGVCSY